MPGLYMYAPRNATSAHPSNQKRTLDNPSPCRYKKFPRFFSEPVARHRERASAEAPFRLYSLFFLLFYICDDAISREGSFLGGFLLLSYF